MIIGIVVALSDELDTLTRQGCTRGKAIHLLPHCIVIYAGAGAHNAKKASAYLLDLGVTHLMSWGCAGALNPTLNAGDLLLAHSIVNAQGEKYLVDSHWHKTVTQSLHQVTTLHHGTLLNSDQVIASVAAKQQCYQLSHADALDMESFAIAQVAQQHGIPFLAIRVIADVARMPLPHAVLHSLDSHGEVILWQLVTYLITHPREVPALIRLGFAFQHAKNTLKLVAKTLDLNG